MHSYGNSYVAGFIRRKTIYVVRALSGFVPANFVVMYSKNVFVATVSYCDRPFYRTFARGSTPVRSVN